MVPACAGTTGRESLLHNCSHGLSGSSLNYDENLLPSRSLAGRRRSQATAALLRHGGARHFLAAQIDLVDPAGVADLIERIGVQHDEVSVAAGRDQPGIDLGDLG